MLNLLVIWEEGINYVWGKILEIGFRVERNYKGFIYVDRLKIKLLIV